MNFYQEEVKILREYIKNSDAANLALIDSICNVLDKMEERITKLEGSKKRNALDEMEDQIKKKLEGAKNETVTITANDGTVTESFVLQPGDKCHPIDGHFTVYNNYATAAYVTFSYQRVKTGQET
jgi:hypothetical protein